MNKLYKKGSKDWVVNGKPQKKAYSPNAAQFSIFEQLCASMRERHGPRKNGTKVPRSCCLEYLALDANNYPPVAGVPSVPGEKTRSWDYRAYPDQQESIDGLVELYQSKHPGASPEEAFTGAALAYLAHQ